MGKASAYFGGANSARGFVNYLGTITKDVERLYILKGGSGCGKNSLMAKVAAAAEQRGEAVERIYCASDPQSLDGVLLRGRGVGVIDGTAPHEMSPRLVGVQDNLVDLGEYWSVTALREQGDIIRQASARKAECYERGYSLLAAAGCLRSQRRRLTDSALLWDKMAAAAGRIAARLAHKGAALTTRVRPLNAFCGKGLVTAQGYGGVLWAVSDPYDTASRLYEVLLGVMRGTVSVSPDATDAGRTGALLAEESGVLIATGNADGAERVINMERFVDKEAIRNMRQRLRFLAKAEEALTEAAATALAEARLHHLRLEQAYIPAMDFDRVNERTHALIKEMLA